MKKKLYNNFFSFLLINSTVNVYSMDMYFLLKQNIFFNAALSILSTSFKKELCYNSFGNDFLHDPILDVLSTTLKSYASKSFFCSRHNDISIKWNMRTTKNNLEHFFMYISVAEVFSCTSQKWYHQLKPSLTEAKHEFAYLLCTDWLPVFDTLLHHSLKNSIASDEFQMIHNLSVARFIGYYLARGDYKEYKKLKCMFHLFVQDPCTKVREVSERKYIPETQEYKDIVYIDDNTKKNCIYKIERLMYFLLTHDHTTWLNTADERFDTTLQQFTMTILKIWTFYRNKKYDLYDIFKYTGQENVQFYTRYFSKNDFEEAIKNTPFGTLLEQNGIYLMPQRMGEGYYKNASLKKIIKKDVRRIIVCPANRSIKDFFYGKINLLYNIPNKINNKLLVNIVYSFGVCIGFFVGILIVSNIALLTTVTLLYFGIIEF